VRDERRESVECGVHTPKCDVEWVEEGRTS
jgi:hypothetical protein